jgi:hypothetical protein
METTTIRVSSNLKNLLDSLKIIPRETYEELLFRIIEPNLELSNEFLQECKKAEEDNQRFTFEEVLACMK